MELFLSIRKTTWFAYNNILSFLKVVLTENFNFNQVFIEFINNNPDIFEVRSAQEVTCSSSRKCNHPRKELVPNVNTDIK